MLQVKLAAEEYGRICRAIWAGIIPKPGVVQPGEGSDADLIPRPYQARRDP
jgi:hypothetical protein